MARVNIEDTLWTDLRFMRLCVLLGDELRAIGAIVGAFRLAQKFWFPEKKPIPELQFNCSRLPLALVESGLVVQGDGGFYVCGSEEQFAWLFHRQAGGKASVDARNKKRKKANLTAVNSSSTALENSQEDASSYSSSFSSSLSNSGSESKNLPEGSKAPPVPSKGSLVWEAYREAYWKRYGIEPVRNAMVNSQCAQLAKRLGDESKHVVGFYLNHPDAFYVRNRHPIGFLVKDAEKIRTDWKMGEGISTTRARQTELAVDNRSAAQEAVRILAERGIT